MSQPPSRSRLRVGALVALLCASTPPACEDATLGIIDQGVEAPDAGGAQEGPCAEGARRPCPCPEGAQGTQVCEVGVFSACACAPAGEAVCGDGAVEGDEECDDGDRDAGDDCTNACALARCGDGVTLAGVEECDDGNDVDTDACTNACTSAICGDGVLFEGVERCDDGNRRNGDRCSDSCVVTVCGDGVVQEGEECDDGNDDPADACTNACTLARCGDGVAAQGEECDDGNDSDEDACTSSCARARCGDGLAQTAAGEECDDGNDSDEDACLSSCRAATCGDGALRADLDPRDVGYEECDDGNAAPGDGCSEQCRDECAADADCKDPEKRGPWGACDPTTLTCRLKVPAFRLESVTSVSVTDGGVLSNLAQPALVAELQASLQRWINEGKLIVVAAVGEYGQTYEHPHEALSASFFQGQPTGLSSVAARGDLPVYRYQPTYQDCSANGVFEHCYTSSPAIISLYIPYLGTATCSYQVLTLNTQLGLNAKPGQRAQITLTGFITPRDARLFQLAASLTLQDALSAVEPTIDCNGDRTADAWAITIAGEASEKELLSPPVGAAPSGPAVSDSADDCNPPPSDEELQTLLDAECARCHGAERAEAGLSLARPFRDKVLNQPSTTVEGAVLVRARSYEDSVLYQRAGEPHGGQRTTLGPANVARLKEWILDL